MLINLVTQRELVDPNKSYYIVYDRGDQKYECGGFGEGKYLLGPHFFANETVRKRFSESEAMLTEVESNFDALEFARNL